MSLEEVALVKVRCDQCQTPLVLPGTAATVRMPPPWRTLIVPGWVGTFYACSAKCEQALLARKLEELGAGGGDESTGR